MDVRAFIEKNAGDAAGNFGGNGGASTGVTSPLALRRVWPPIALGVAAAATSTMGFRKRKV